MSDPYQKIKASSWNRFLTRYLHVEPTLLGETHEFLFKSRKVRVQLPNESLEKYLDADSSPPAKESRIAIKGYMKKDGRRIPISVQNKNVDLTIEIPQEITIHNEMLLKPHNWSDDLQTSQINFLNNLADEYGEIAEKAFEYWVKVLRWKSRNATITRPEIRHYHSGLTTYLFENESKKRIWGGKQFITATRYKPLNGKMWASAQRALKDSRKPPLFYEFYFDGIEHRKNEDFQRAVVDFAVACEVLMRSTLNSSLPTELPSSIEGYIDDANIRTIMSKMFSDLLTESGGNEFNSISSDLHKLFDARNQALHKGNIPNLTDDITTKYQNVTKRFIEIKENRKFWK